MHQAFKYDLIATLPRAGGHLTAETIRAWITTRIPPSEGTLCLVPSNTWTENHQWHSANDDDAKSWLDG